MPVVPWEQLYWLPTNTMDLKRIRWFPVSDLQKGSYLGPSFSQNEIEAFLNRHNYSFNKYETVEERNISLAKELNAGKILGYFDGRMEFGPRSLGGQDQFWEMQGIRICNLK